MKLSGKKKFEFILAYQFPFASTFHHSSFRTEADSVFYLVNCLFLWLSLEALILLIKKERKKKKKTPKRSPAQLVVSLALRNIKNQNQKMSGSHGIVSCQRSNSLTDTRNVISWYPELCYYIFHIISFFSSLQVTQLVVTGSIETQWLQVSRIVPIMTRSKSTGSRFLHHNVSYCLRCLALST